MSGSPVFRAPRRLVLVHGLRLVLRRPGALFWTFAANLIVALLFSLRLHAQLASILDHSFAAERLNSAFDLGTLGAVFFRLQHHSPGTGMSGYLGLPLYFLIYFILVPGTLFSYRIDSPGRLAILLSSGLCFFWRFVRISLLTAVVSAILLGPLFALQALWSDYVEEHVVGRPGFYEELAGALVILLVASLVRLYFDLVEVYTVQLDDHFRPSGKPDRRVHKTLLPAAKTLWRNLPHAWGSFALIAFLGLTAVFFTARIALHTLAQPRVWPQFLLIQTGLFLNMLARFWQRGAETILVEDNPLPRTLALQEAGVTLQPSCSSFIYEKKKPFAMESGLRSIHGVEEGSNLQPLAPRRSDSGIFRVYPPPPTVEEPPVE